MKKTDRKEEHHMKKAAKLLSIILAVVVLFVSFPIQTEAATVKLNKTKATLYIGKTTTLKVKGTSEKVTWTSSNKKVATVSSKGKVTGKKTGTATITAKVGKKSYKCKVTVKKPYINEIKKKIGKGESFILKLKGTEIKSVKSSNSKVATVIKKGKVTGKKAGTATITITGKNGKTYKCKVTVSKLPFLPNQIYDTGDTIYYWRDPALPCPCAAEAERMAFLRWGNCVGDLQADSYKVSDNKQYFKFVWKAAQ